MEQQEPRRSFVNNLYNFCKPIELNKRFLEEIKGHNYSEYLKEVEVFMRILFQINFNYIFPILRNSVILWLRRFSFFSSLLEMRK
jgi:hypothetical protein